MLIYEQMSLGGFILHFISGGEVPAAILTLLRDSSWPSSIATSGPTVGHVIYANDICPLKDAFVALYNGLMACWGNGTTCTGD